MAELRYHPFIKDWVMIASHRQGRPAMPKDWCPFCPGSGKVPESYDVLRYDNDFPALSQSPHTPDDVGTGFFQTMPSYGKCEVILYAPEHEITMKQLSDERVSKLTRLWRETFIDISADDKIKYVYIFENRGELVGVTMPHPHGQVYGYPFIPKKIELETLAAREYFDANGRCIFCDSLDEELAFGKRIIFKNEAFVVYLPFYSEYPYGVYLQPLRHVPDITGLNETELDLLGVTVKQISGMFDNLYDFQFPFMMCMHNAPVNSGDYSKDFHFHIEYFSPIRSKDQVKFNASSETGAWAHCNPTCPEEASIQLREAYARFMSR